MLNAQGKTGLGFGFQPFNDNDVPAGGRRTACRCPRPTCPMGGAPMRGRVDLKAAPGGARAPLIACPSSAGGSSPLSLHVVAVQPVNDVWTAVGSLAASVQSAPEEATSGDPRRQKGPSECCQFPVIVNGSNWRTPPRRRPCRSPSWRAPPIAPRPNGTTRPPRPRRFEPSHRRRRCCRRCAVTAAADVTDPTSFHAKEGRRNNGRRAMLAPPPRASDARSGTRRSHASAQRHVPTENLTAII